MYAIIKTGGKQYRVQENDVFKIEKIQAEPGDTVTFDEVMAVGGESLTVGAPYVAGAAVQAEVLEQGKNDKVIIYKYKAKKDYRRKNGHRQPYTLVKVTGIVSGGEDN
ncbi:MAG: 50S ribosomal protein L21 [Mogibacterium sp.]|nr:50S ribosomal protein L21 [Mogibacterium sp.]